MPVPCAAPRREPAFPWTACGDRDAAVGQKGPYCRLHILLVPRGQSCVPGDTVVKGALRARSRGAAEDLRCLSNRELAPVSARKPQDLGLARGHHENTVRADVASGTGNRILADQGKEVPASAIRGVPRVRQEALVSLPGNRFNQPGAELLFIPGQEEDGTGRLSVPAGASRFLQVRLHGGRDVGVDDRADIRLVHAQPICAGGNEGPVPGVEKPLLNPRAFFSSEPRVIKRNRSLRTPAPHYPGGHFRVVAGAAENEQRPLRRLRQFHEGVSA